MSREDEDFMPNLNADGYFDLRFSQDKIQVFLDVYPPQGGGRNASADDIVAALQRRGVAYGFQFDAIENAIHHVAVQATPVCGVVAAQGQIPVAGTNAQIVWKIDVEAASRPFPVLPDGLPDYFAYDPARLVKAGHELATVIPGLPGTPGKTLVVPYELVPQGPGREAPVIAGPGARLTANRQRYEAEVTGFVEYHGEKLSVRALSMIEGDLLGGDHPFPGGVIVLGDVRGASITARGPVAIKGRISDSDVRAAGHIVFHDAEKSRIVADGDTYLRRTMRDCEVVTLKNVIADQGSSISGGSVSAAEGVEAFDLGSESGPITDAALGGDVYCSIRIREIEHEIVAAESNVKRITFALRPLMSITAEPISATKRQLMQTLLDQKRELEQFIRNLHAERRARQMAHFDRTGVVRITGRIHAGTRLNLYGTHFKVERSESGIEYRRSADGDSVMTTPVDAVSMLAAKAA
jgi:uncharacterized protein (DUF342 family)